MSGDIDWLAGVFSAAGSAGLYKGRPTLSLCRDDFQLLKSVQNRFGGIGEIKYMKRANSEHRVYTSGPNVGMEFDTQETWLFEWKALDRHALLGMQKIYNSPYLSSRVKGRISVALNEFFVLQDGLL